MARAYPWAVVDGNQSDHRGERPESCHMTLRAAFDAARRANRGGPNYHYHVVRWHATPAHLHHHLDRVHLYAPRDGDRCPPEPDESDYCPSCGQYHGAGRGTPGYSCEGGR